jgi:hypothetical protein
MHETELEAIRRNVNRGQPYGGESWIAETSVKLGPEFTLRSRGRPRATHEQNSSHTS